jgi:hypothetical protein
MMMYACRTEFASRIRRRSNDRGGVAVSESAAAGQHDEPPIQGLEERQREELQMLLFGFGTGMLVAGIFLIYVVLDIAHLL